MNSKLSSDLLMKYTGKPMKEPMKVIDDSNINITGMIRDSLSELKSVHAKLMTYKSSMIQDLDTSIEYINETTIYKLYDHDISIIMDELKSIVYNDLKNHDDIMAILSSIHHTIMNDSIYLWNLDAYNNLSRKVTYELYNFLPTNSKLIEFIPMITNYTYPIRYEDKVAIITYTEAIKTEYLASLKDKVSRILTCITSILDKLRNLKRDVCHKTYHSKFTYDSKYSGTHKDLKAIYDKLTRLEAKLYDCKLIYRQPTTVMATLATLDVYRLIDLYTDIMNSIKDLYTYHTTNLIELERIYDRSIAMLDTVRF